MLHIIEEKFGLSMAQEGEGEQLELEMGYPDTKTMRLDALYELQNMAALAEKDMGEMGQVSKADMEFLMKKYKGFMDRFSSVMDGLEVKGRIRDCFYNLEEDAPEYFFEWFTLHCKACIGELLLKETGLKI